MSRRERKNLHVASYLLLALVGVVLGMTASWVWVPAAVFLIAFSLALFWPTLCRAYRTDQGICESPVNGWLTGCASHAPVKRRDLRAVLWPPNEVSPFHRAALAIRVPPREQMAQAILDGAPRRVTLRNFTACLVLALSGLVVVAGLAFSAI
ncbi:conserved membrane hypothetical protein [Frankia sp. AiPs1]|uniref:hypothetical protein n=1 Tax=Frankia sp. AiPa1 TaxID=573492 RepID=UPI00202B611A|nr:hypothetical protein [Frankia sp. AiPa1]MCL9762633.1 hypothetical protein [Frankia sp. AiPa1]